MRAGRFRVVILLLTLAVVSYGAYSAHAEPVFTEAEKLFIDSHPDIRIGVDPLFIPFEFFSRDGTYSGIAADILSEISDITGLEFVSDPEMTWTEAVQASRQGDIDMLPAVGYTAARAEYLTYLKPYMQFQRSIVIHHSNTSISGLSDLKGRQVAVQKDSSHEGFLLEYPDIEIRTYHTVEEALLAVNRGEEVAFVGNEATSIYLSRTLGLSELKFITLAEGGAQSLHIAVRSDWPELASILQKSLDAIPESEYSAILGTWIRYENTTDYTLLIRISLIVLAFLILIIAVSSFWILRLHKAIREKEQAQQFAERSDSEKGMFMARVSHEIRTPLNGIRGMSYLLEKTSLDANQSRYLHAIKGATQTMQVIINDILEYSRLEQGRTVLEKIPFRIDDVLQNTLALDAWLIREKGLTFTLKHDPSVPPFLIGDPTRIRQILTNLLHNAVKFTSEGSIELSLEAKEVSAERCLLSFEIKDSGIGMSRKQLSELFTPFTQADESITRKYGGSGLGLSIVKGLVETMEGSIEAESDERRGSTFRVHLPLAIDIEGAEQDLMLQKSVDFSSLNALLVLPGRNLSSRIGSLLREYRIAYEEVSSLPIAQTLLSGESRCDLLILELEHAGMIPSDLFERITSADGSRPSIILFVHDEDHEENRRVLSGTSDIILPLPVINSVFFNALLQLFGKGESRSGDEVNGETVHPSPQALNVLVVEDNMTNQMIARELLEREGFTVFLADNGKTGYEMFLEKEPLLDVILMDLHMDVMDGYESTALIREKNMDIPILILSADLVDSVREKCDQMHVSGFIGKPYDPDMLLSKVREAGESFRRPGRELFSIDFDLGVRRMGGDRSLYRMVLTSFINEVRELLYALREAVKQGEAAGAASLVHKCKGSCGSIGALRAHTLCVRSEKELRAGESGCSSPLIQELMEELEHVLEQARMFQ